MSDLELLEAVVSEKIDLIIGMSLSAKSFLNLMISESIHLELFKMTCNIDRDKLVFAHDFPEKQQEFDTIIDIERAIKSLQYIISGRYHNETMQAQFNN